MATGNRIVVFSITKKGLALARTISRLYPGATCEHFSADAVKTHWTKGTNLVFVMATGIVVRTIAPLLTNKRIDPAVVVLDELGEHAISLVGGHLGGANTLASEIARLIGARPVITTASDVNGLPSVDLWAQDLGLAIEDWKALPKVGSKLVDQGTLRVFSDIPIDLPKPYQAEQEPAEADMAVTNKTGIPGLQPDAVVLRPRNLVAGIGCNSNTAVQEIEDAVRKVVADNGLAFLSLRAVGTIDQKGSEPGLVAFAQRHGLPLLTFTADQLNGVPDVAPSEAAKKATGAKAVAEPSALLASLDGRLVVTKRRMGNVTVAIAEETGRLSGKAHGSTKEGKVMIYVVGTGPGSADHITPQAVSAIRASDVVVGYGTYLNLIRGLLIGKEVVSTGMAQEIDRCRRAIELSAEGRTVSVISGGDPGIYAMAGLVFDLLRKEDAPLAASQSVQVVPGISALNASAALLGAPLMHDFAVISLSDRLTPWQTIKERLHAAASADFVIVLYNPKSAGRQKHIQKAQAIVLSHRPAQTPVGIVKAAMRAEERVIISDLGHMPFDEIDMQTTVIIGNSRTVVWNGRMITPRGYENKETW